MWESQLQTLRWGFRMLSDGDALSPATGNDFHLTSLACTLKSCQPFQGPSD